MDSGQIQKMGQMMDRKKEKPKVLVWHGGSICNARNCNPGLRKEYKRVRVQPGDLVPTTTLKKVHGNQILGKEKTILQDIFLSRKTVNKQKSVRIRTEAC